MKVLHLRFPNLGTICLKTARSDGLLPFPAPEAALGTREAWNFRLETEYYHWLIHHDKYD